jgi:hypothetical protein
MDKLELDDRVTRLERRVSLCSALMSAAALAIFAGAFLMAVGVTVSEEATPAVARVSSPAPPAGFEVELRNAHKLQEQGLITREDFDQKKEMILDAPLPPSDEVQAMEAAKALVDEGILNEAEYGILKRKILKFGK